jgi:hypothetical protein
MFIIVEFCRVALWNVILDVSIAILPSPTFCVVCRPQHAVNISLILQINHFNSFLSRADSAAESSGITQGYKEAEEITNQALPGREDSVTTRTSEVTLYQTKLN